mgnify:FL=1
MQRHLLIVCLGILLQAGCAPWTTQLFRSQSPAEENEPSSTRLVRDIAVPFGLFPIRVESVGLVTGLGGTGSDPAPSAERAALVAEMSARGVDSPNTILASKTTSLVLIRAVLRPGIQKGDHLDVEVRVPSRSETTSLRGGWLMQARLQEMGVMKDNQIHKGNTLALAEGPIMVDPSAQPGKDNVSLGRGRILGGALALKSRPLGLVLTPGNQTVGNASRIANVVNKRFHMTVKGIQTGVAKAKTDQLVELAVHPRYKDNIDRYVEVVRAVAIRETSVERSERLESLKRQLLDPATANSAARQLEAIGRDALDALREGLTHSDREVRFYAAESLAYLDQREAAEPLAQIARDEPAFRVFALSALGAMEDPAAYDQLVALLHQASAETRYGAYRALTSMRPNDPLVHGDPSIKDFHYSVVDTNAQPMIHVTSTRRPEVVLFGRQQWFGSPLSVNAGPHIMVTGLNANEISVSRYVVGQADQKRTVSCNVDEVVRAIVDLGGTYPDVVQALEEAKRVQALNSRFAVDALPEAGRSYVRGKKDEFDSAEEGGKVGESTPAKGDKDSENEQTPAKGRGFLAKMMGRGES